MATGKRGDDDDEPTPKLPLPTEYRIQRRRAMRDPDDSPGGNGTGRTDLNKVKDEEIVRLRALLAERDSDPSIGATVKHWRRMVTAVSGVIALCSALFAGLAWYTSSAVSTAMAAERLATQDRIDTSLRLQLANARYAPMETVAVQQQQLSDIDRRLTEMNAKIDVLLTRVQPRPR